MATGITKIRPPVKRHGGKSYLAKRIISLMPEHRIYVEPFLGGGSVLLNKPRAEAEIACDLDAGLIGMWRALQPPTGLSMLAMLDELPYDEGTFNTAACWLKSPHASARAIGYLVRSRFSRGGLGETFAWSDRLRGGQPGDANAWETFRKVDLPAICERARGVTFLHADGIGQVAAWREHAHALLYLDPPYVHATRTASAAYEHEMSDADHERLLGLLADAGCTAKVMLSGYACPLYDAALAGWRRVDFDLPNHSSQSKTKQRRIECFWLNF